MSGHQAEIPTSASSLARFPVKTWLIAFAGWTLDFYDLVLFSFQLSPIERELSLSATQEAWLTSAAIYGIAFHWQARRLGVPMVLALFTAAWVWTLPETRGRDLAAIASES